MRISRSRRLFAAVAVIALVASMCGDDDDEDAADDETTETTEEAEGQDELPVEGTLITATDYEFDGAEELHASTATVTFRNDGNTAHEMGMVRLPDDKTPEDFFADFQTAVVETDGAGPYPDYWFDPGAFTGIGGVQPGEQKVSEFSLTEGNWLLFCSFTDADTEGGDEGGGGGADEGTQGQAEEEEPQLPPHYENGMFQLVEVEGDAEPTEPEGDATITAQEDGDEYSFDVPALKAGEQRLAVVNSAENQQAHHGILFKFGEGVKPGDVPGILEGVFSEEEGGGGGEEDGTQGRAQGPPPFEDVDATSVFTPGFGGTLDVTLEEGTYAFLCFLSDREGGPPHALGRGMIAPFEVTD